MCRVGQRYTVTVTSSAAGPLSHVDGVGREEIIRHAVRSARWELDAIRRFRRGEDIS